MMQNEKRLRVLFLPAWYPSEVHPLNGIFIKEHAKAASLYNNIVVLYTYGDPSPQPRGLYRVSEEVEDGIRTIRVKYGGVLGYLKRLVFKNHKEIKHPKSSAGSNKAISVLKGLLGTPLILVGDLLYYWSVFAAFRRLVKEGWEFDIIHAHVFTAGVPAIILGKLYHIPIVITEHYSGFQRHELTLSERIKARFALNRAVLVLPVSYDLQKHIERYGIRNRFEVVPPTVNTRQFRAELSGDTISDTKKILLVSALIPRKGIAYLLQALNQIKQKRLDFCLDIVGDGPNREEYGEMAQTLDLGQAVNFHGRLPRERLVKLMQCCDFFILPSLSENLPSVLIEAMVCGKPVIASNVGGIKEVINEERGISVPPKDVKALKEAIEYMLDNYQNYSSEKIGQYARGKFSYEAVGKTLDEVYRNVL